MSLTRKPISVYISNEKFVIKNDSYAVSFDPLTKNIKEFKEFSSLSQSKVFSVYNIVGYIKGNVNSYIIATSEVYELGTILQSKVYKITKFVYIPNKISQIPEEDQTYLKMLDDFLERNPLYFSDTMDLTISCKSYKEKKEKQNVFVSFIFPFSIPYFAWNYTIAKDFDYKGMNQFIYPIINGYVGITSPIEYSSSLTYVLIARKDTRRSGMRFLIRGSDINGNVANFVETEELLYFNDGKETNILSFVQIKGSVPLIWSQEPSLQLNPPIIPKDNFQENTEVFNLHMNSLIKTYEGVYAINLIDKKKDQKTLGDYYHTLYTNYKEENKDAKLVYVWFDFHTECKKMKYENLSKLLKSSSVLQAVSNMNFTHIKFDNSVVKNNIPEQIIDFLPYTSPDQLVILSVQSGVFRTNCVDCLDRTNVVQTLFGRVFLYKMLNKIDKNVIPNGNPFQAFHPSFEKNFKFMWADHGDNLSLAYSGTGALKADYVRTGKRTLMGNIHDGYLSCKRFYINNFKDGYNQDCHDYFLGVLHPKKHHFKQHSTRTLMFIFPILLLTAYFIYYLLISFAFPKNATFSFKKLIFKFFLFIGSLILTLMVLGGNLKKSIIDTHSKHE